jgi:hypothetical protein
MGANLTQWGATFRVWAPNANSVTVQGSFSGWSDQPLTGSPSGYWYAFVPGVKDGDQYKFYRDRAPRGTSVIPRPGGGGPGIPSPLQIPGAGRRAPSAELRGQRSYGVSRKPPPR